MTNVTIKSVASYLIQPFKDHPSLHGCRTDLRETSQDKSRLIIYWQWYTLGWTVYAISCQILLKRLFVISANPVTRFFINALSHNMEWIHIVSFLAYTSANPLHLSMYYNHFATRTNCRGRIEFKVQWNTMVVYLSIVSSLNTWLLLGFG